MKLPRLRLTQVEDFTGTIRTVFLNIGFFSAILLLVPAVASQFSSNAIVIDPISVPTALSDRGITPEVAANRLWDSLQTVSREASLARATLVAVPNSRVVRFSLPDTTISIDSLFKSVRQFFGNYETHIAGEIICGTPDCAPQGQRLRLRVIRSTSQIVDLPPLGGQSEGDYFREAAAGVYDVLDPFVAIAARAVSEPETAALFARKLAIGQGPDAKWAHSLLGDMARNRGDAAAAIPDYRAALALDDNFTQARISLARALVATGDTTGAQVEIALAAQHAGAAPGLATARAELALALGDKPEATAQYLLAAEQSPIDPLPLVKAASLELQIDRTASAVGHLQEALNLDPGYVDALRLLGNTYREDGDLAAAERMFRDWADYVPTSAEAHRTLAELLLERDNPEAAAASYARLVALDPGNVEDALARARVLKDLARYPQAVDSLTPFADAETPDARALLLLAQTLEAFGRSERALARYQQFVALFPDAPERPEVEAAIAALQG